ncbi:MAG: hypothetical protein ACRDX8_02275 [Acidimicrobiales bacterium]
MANEGDEAVAPAAKRVPPLRPSFVVPSLLIGLYAMAPGIWLGGLHVKRNAEIVDHVIPGLVVLASILVAVSWGPARRGASTVLFGASLVIGLAGLWMAATHVGLLLQGIRGQAPGPSVAYHCSTAFLTLVLGVTWVGRHWSAVASPAGEQTPAGEQEGGG